MLGTLLKNLLGGKQSGKRSFHDSRHRRALEKAKRLFDKWGILAVALGAFTPVPYTIVVFLAGISKMDFKKYMIAGILGRVPRYVIGGYLLVFIVQEINSEVINEYMLIMSIIGMLLVVLYYVLQSIYNIYKKKQQA